MICGLTFSANGILAGFSRASIMLRWLAIFFPVSRFVKTGVSSWKQGSLFPVGITEILFLVIFVDEKIGSSGRTMIESLSIRNYIQKRRTRGMMKIIAYCGLVCSSCPTYLATQNDDDEARATTAAFYSKKFGFSLKPEDINCDGCLSRGGRLIGYCSACHVRKCCSAKGLANCMVCNQQPCERLKKFHASSQDARDGFQMLMKEQRKRSI